MEFLNYLKFPVELFVNKACNKQAEFMLILNRYINIKTSTSINPEPFVHSLYKANKIFLKKNIQTAINQKVFDEEKNNVSHLKKNYSFIQFSKGFYGFKN